MNCKAQPVGVSYHVGEGGSGAVGQLSVAMCRGADLAGIPQHQLAQDVQRGFLGRIKACETEFQVVLRRWCTTWS